MGILDLIILLIILAWLGGFSLNVGGSLIHLLLVILVVVIVYRVISGRNINP